MMKYCKNIYEKLVSFTQKLDNLLLLLVRLVLAYGFFNPAKMKWQNIDGIASWFESLNYPLPLLNAYLAAITEGLGVVLLLLGLGARIISLPLIFVMLVTIFTVHISNGFEAGDNGFEIPLYYLLLLLVVLVHGAGKYSLDGLLKKR